MLPRLHEAGRQEVNRVRGLRGLWEPDVEVIPAAPVETVVVARVDVAVVDVDKRLAIGASAPDTWI